MYLLKIVGAIFFLIGMCIFLVGKKFVILRAYFGDRSMFSQLFWGFIFVCIGAILLYFSGTFTQ